MMTSGMFGMPIHKDADKKEDEKKQLLYEMGKTSRKIADQFDSQTHLPSKPLPVIESNLVTQHKLLGRGGFNDVHEVLVKSDGCDGDGEKKEEIMMAMKHLKSSVMSERGAFYSGAVDLVMEAKLLNSLSHKNIIYLHGTSCNNASLDNTYSNGERFCLYLDRLHETVGDKFEQWRRTYVPHADKRRQQLQHRLETIALPIAEAMEYLHSKHIIFRDLKPMNMGFDENGTVKLFDFGLAREILPRSSRKLTGATGSRRYMAPEVAMSCPYGLPADVYSFGIFLYECTTLRKPYSKMSRSEHIEKAIYGRYRPPFDSRCESPGLRRLIQKCWAKSPRSRPDFPHVIEQLKEELDTMNKKEEKQIAQKEHGHRFFFQSPWSSHSRSNHQQNLASVGAS